MWKFKEGVWGGERWRQYTLNLMVLLQVCIISDSKTSTVTNATGTATATITTRTISKVFKLSPRTPNSSWSMLRSCQTSPILGLLERWGIAPFTASVHTLTIIRATTPHFLTECSNYTLTIYLSLQSCTPLLNIPITSSCWTTWRTHSATACAKNLGSLL